MQGYLVKDSVSGDIKPFCTNCVDCFSSKDFFIDGLMLVEDLRCLDCTAVIDGEEEEPKPQSFTVTVEVVVYADDDVQTAVDASDYVVDILAGYFDHSEATDVKEHF